MQQVTSASISLLGSLWPDAAVVPSKAPSGPFSLLEWPWADEPASFLSSYVQKQTNKNHQSPLLAITLNLTEFLWGSLPQEKSFLPSRGS